MLPLLFFLCLYKPLYSKPISIEVKADSAILINADTGVVLFEKNIHQALHPASITKIATALYAIKKKGDCLEEIIEAKQDALVSVSEEAKRKVNYTLPAHWLVPGGTHIGIKKGEELSLKDLLRGMLISSGNDAANVIAEYVSGSVPKFMDELNAYLKELGCQYTKFYNPHGLYHPQHQSSASDMAIIAREAMKYPVFRQIVSQVKYERPKTNKQEATTLLQTNKLLRKGPLYNAKAIGIKTGYIANASHTFIGAGEHAGRTLIAVLIKTKNREDIFKDTNRLFEVAFAEEKVSKTFLKRGAQSFELMLQGANRSLKTMLTEDLIYEYYPAEELKVKCTLFWNEGLKVPIKAGQVVAKLQLETINGQLLKELPLIAVSEVDLSWKARIAKIWKESRLLKVLPPLSLLLVGMFLIRRKYAQKLL